MTFKTTGAARTGGATTGTKSKRITVKDKVVPTPSPGPKPTPPKKDPKSKTDKVKHKVNTPPVANPNKPIVIPTGIGLNGYRWNLPPHQWSLPVEPHDMDSLVVNSEAFSLGSKSKYRRGRIYWYSRVDTTKVDYNTYNTGVKSKNGEDHSKDPRYGFQFLWNPNEINTSVSVNMDITPSFADQFVNVVGAFPSGEYLTFTLRLDRTNDFACIKSTSHIPKASGEITTYDKLAKEYTGYYSAASAFDYGFGDDVVDKIQDLQKYGTIADLEYLYKAINGPGWTNLATGKNSSDIGFLSPTLLKIDIGPLSYLGYVNNISINHMAFSKDMIPIRTDVGLQFNLMATAGLSSK
jgi:hypothetical protein